jgi:hypothetical protein
MESFEVCGPINSFFEICEQCGYPVELDATVRKELDTYLQVYKDDVDPSVFCFRFPTIPTTTTVSKVDTPTTDRVLRYGSNGTRVFAIPGPHELHPDLTNGKTILIRPRLSNPDNIAFRVPRAVLVAKRESDKLAYSHTSLFISDQMTDDEKEDTGGAEKEIELHFAPRQVTEVLLWCCYHAVVPGDEIERPLILNGKCFMDALSPFDHAFLERLTVGDLFRIFQVSEFIDIPALSLFVHACISFLIAIKGPEHFAREELSKYMHLNLACASNGPLTT